ncbi:L-asparaginase [Hexamita inflata]|uniref:asparaginase n=1 Tax=Hexamita inflata TaxID=28002 RepID=A0AA86Q386_9EUKA|nr:L-asparaginase [Hexamita inflata]
MQPIEMYPQPPGTPQLDTVAVIYTGGTIGMCKNQDGQYAPDPDYLVHTMRNTPLFKHHDLPKYHVMSIPPLLDSASMNIDDWVRIARTIESLYDLYLGFVVIHGTDTLAFTASILSFILVNLKKPVVITGSQLPLCECYSDGYFNLVGAIRATTWNINEVCVYFNNKLMRGNRVQKYSAWAIDAFDTASIEPLAIQGTDLKLNKHVITSMTPVWPTQVTSTKLTVTTPCKDIAITTLYPGFQPKLLRAFIGFRGLVIQAFGTGNGPSTLEFLSELQNLHLNGCVIVVVTQTHTGLVNLGQYEAASTLRSAGCISGYCMTSEAAFCKLSYLCGLGLNQEQVEQSFGQVLRGEFDTVEM